MPPSDFREQLAALATTLGSIETVLDLETMRKQLAELEGEAAHPELWNDQERAQRVTSRMSHLRSDLARLDALRSRLDDAQAALDLDDEALIEEAGPAPPALAVRNRGLRHVLRRRGRDQVGDVRRQDAVRLRHAGGRARAAPAGADLPVRQP